MSYTLSTDKTPEDTMKDLWRTFEAWPEAEFMHARNLKDGLDTAEVYFEFRGTPVRIHYGHQHRYRNNLRAVYLTLEGLRLSFKRGLGDILTDTVSQMLSLGEGARQRDPYEVLGVRPDAPMEDVEDMYRIKAKRAHPDTGGSDEAMAELNAAVERVRSERGVTA